jgi:hypothetical protein
MNKKAIAIIASLTVLVIAGVVGILWWRGHLKNNSQEAWRAVLKNCATSNLLGSNVVYFGASNRVGPGSIWRKATDGSYRLFYELSDLESDDEKRKKLVILNNDVSCQGDATSDWSIKVGLPFESSAIALKADVSADLKMARNVKVAITAYAMDELKEGLFEDVIRNNPRLNQTPGVFVIAENAIRVNGFSADFTFTEDVANQIRPKYDNNYISLKEGATLKSDWTSKTNLKMTATDPFYILAGFSNVTFNKSGNGIVVAMAGPVQGNKVPALGSERVTNTATEANRQINAALGTNLLNPPNVTVKPSNDGSLVLVGSVSTPEEREKVEKIVKSVPDVAVVRNQVKIDQRFVVR